MSANLGNSNAMYMLGVFSNFQLDGSFNIITNLLENIKNKDLNITAKLASKLYSFTNERRFSNVVTNLYFSSL